MSTHCPDPEQLLLDLALEEPEARAHVAGCRDCASLVELHRQLEKDLLRLADPPPPPDFVHKVMARVQAQPVAPAREVWTFAGILAGTLAALGVLVLTDAGTAGAWGTRIASFVIGIRDGLEMTAQAGALVWETAALPLMVAAMMALLTLTFAARRLLGGRAQARVRA